MEKQHQLIINGKTVSVTGVAQVVSIDAAEAELKLENVNLTIFGENLNVVNLNTESGSIVIEYSAIKQLRYGKGVANKFSLKGIFK